MIDKSDHRKLPKPVKAVGSGHGENGISLSFY